MAPGLDPAPAGAPAGAAGAGRIFRRNLSARLVSVIALVLFGLAVASHTASRDFGAGYRLVANCLESAGQSVFHIHVHLLGGRRFAWPPG